MNLPSASKLQLAQTCPASWALPHVDTDWQSGRDGQERHRELAAYLVDGVAPVSQWLANLAVEHPESLGRLTAALDEVSLAWHPVTGEATYLGARLERAYQGAPEGALYGTADYFRDAGGVVEIVDLKTGMADVPHPKRNAQLRFLALAGARWLGVSSARVGILHAPEGRAPWWEWADLDAFDLEEEAAKLRQMVERIGWAQRDVKAGEVPRLTVGEHCAWCPARYSCPARTGMARAMADAPADFAASLKTSLDDDGIASMALARWRAARKVLDEVGAALYARAKERPIPDEGGVWGPVVSEREVIDAEKAWLELAALLGPDGARAAMTLETSKAGVERGVRAAKAAGVLTGTIKAGVAQAMDRLRAVGAVETKTTERYETHQPALPEGTDK